MNNISTITNVLKTRFPSLAKVPNDLLSVSEYGEFIFVARRSGTVTITVFIVNDNIPALLDCFELSACAKFQEIIGHADRGVVIDLDYLTADGPWRFYLMVRDSNRDWLTKNYPSTQAGSLTNGYNLDLVGFYLDPTTNQVTQYKTYWSNNQTHSEYRLRFDPNGNFIDSSLRNTTTVLLDDTKSADFRLEDLDFTGLLVTHLSNVDSQQEYVIMGLDPRPPEIQHLPPLGGSVAHTGSWPPPPPSE